MSERGLSGSLGPHVPGCEVGGLLGVPTCQMSAAGPACRWRIDFHACTVSLASAGRTTVRPGIARTAARCSTGWWVGPSSPRPIESCVHTYVTGMQERDYTRASQPLDALNRLPARLGQDRGSQSKSMTALGTPAAAQVAPAYDAPDRGQRSAPDQCEANDAAAVSPPPTELWSTMAGSKAATGWSFTAAAASDSPR
jgi:hypothetical protein